MFQKSFKKTSSGFNSHEIDTVLAEDIFFKGMLHFKGSLMINGKFEGEIDAEEGHLFIGKNAVVHARIRVAIVSNMGLIEGDVETTKRFELYTGSRIDGDVITPDLKIEPGSKLNGNCTTIKEDVIPKIH